MSHRPGRDGTPERSRHVPYYLAAEVFSDAWARALAELGPGVLSAADVAVVGAQFAFRHELFTGAAAVCVDIDDIGTSSIRFRLTLYQDDVLAAEGTTTVARTDTGRTRSIPLSVRQRAALDRLRKPPGSATGA